MEVRRFFCLCGCLGNVIVHPADADAWQHEIWELDGVKPIVVPWLMAGLLSVCLN